MSKCFKQKYLKCYILEEAPIIDYPKMYEINCSLSMYLKYKARKDDPISHMMFNCLFLSYSCAIYVNRELQLISLKSAYIFICNDTIHLWNFYRTFTLKTKTLSFLLKKINNVTVPIRTLRFISFWVILIQIFLVAIQDKICKKVSGSG